MRKDYLLELMRSDRSVFTVREISLIWGESNHSFVGKKLYRYAKGDKLFPVRRGIYAKIKEYNRYELAVKIYTPAYISFETVLAEAGIIFQYYSQIFVASYQRREIECDEQKYSFVRLQEDILTSPIGLVSKQGYSTATPERAFLDTVYCHNEYHFDNLSPINWDRVYEILPVYKGNKRMRKSVEKYYRESKEASNGN